jgi:hypothetical protein
MLVWFLVSLVVTLPFPLFIVPWAKAKYSQWSRSPVESTLHGVEIIGIISISFSFMGLGAYLLDYSVRGEHMREAVGHRGVLVRMIEEDYDSKNLENALQFNAEQKLSAFYNSSPWTYCKENCYALDTIPIPTHKFIPTDFVKLDAVIKHIADKEASSEK